jgi:pimeloyl-ACP methyl ester carboxylesterase
VPSMTLAYDVTGSGPDVLLLHSMVGDRRMWDPQVPVLASAGFRVVRCDLPGFGASPVPAGPYNMADDVAGLLDHVGASAVAVVAASGAGNVALELAARWPQRVPALALNGDRSLAGGPAAGGPLGAARLGRASAEPGGSGPLQPAAARLPPRLTLIRSGRAASRWPRITLGG